MRVCVSLLLLVLAGSRVTAQDRQSISPDIETVVSGGHWVTSDSVEGRFRVVIETAGFEHLISTLRVEWIAYPTESDDSARIIAGRDVTTGGGGVYLTDPSLALDAGRWILTVDAVNTHCDPMPTDRWRVALGPPGEVTVLGSTVVRKGCE